jgi:hypothetical protein
MGPRLSDRWLAAGLLVLAVGLAVGATAAPPPQSVCGPCHGGLEAAGAEYNLPLDVTHSTATMQVHRNGSATWHVASRLRNESNSARLRQNAALRWRVAVAAVDASRDYLEPARPDASVQSVWANDSALTFTFREPDVARTLVGGSVLVDEFQRYGAGSGWYVDVDRLRIVGPPGTTVSNDPLPAIGRDIGAVDGRSVTIRGEIGAQPSLASEDPVLAFAAPGYAGGLLTTLGLAIVAAGRMVDGFLLVHLPGLVLLGVLLAAIYRYRGGGDAALDRSTATSWVGIPVTLYLFVTIALYPPAPPRSGWALVLTLGFGVLAVLLAIASWFSYSLLGQHAELTAA